MGPGQYPQYTRADLGLDAVGSSHTPHESKRQTLREGKSRMVAEPQIHGRNTHHVAVSERARTSRGVAC